jgi:hypothetical protein
VPADLLFYFSCADVADVALDHLFLAHIVDVAHKLYINGASILGTERNVVITNRQVSMGC